MGVDGETERRRAGLAAAAAFASTLALGLGAGNAQGAEPAIAAPRPGRDAAQPRASRAAVATRRVGARRTRLKALPPAERANGTWPLLVRLSGPVAPGSPQPRLHPEPPGHWKTIGNIEEYAPDATLEPCAKYVLTIPKGTRARGDRRIGKEKQLDLQVDCPSTRALQQALGRLGYLPYSLRSKAPIAGGETVKEAAERAFAPPQGTLVADVPDAPPLEYGRVDATTEGAIEVYEEDNGVAAGSQEELWRSLLANESRGRRDPRPYTFVTVSENEPETLEVHLGNHVALSSPTNTGVSGAETEPGVFPIYARYVSTSMSGTDPDGVSYDVPDVPWVNYFNGADAVHGYERASYGYPQSNGCVELPPATAEKVYGMLAIGDIVVIER